MSVVFARAIQFAAGLAILMLSSLGASVDERKDIRASHALDGTEIIEEFSKKTASLVCGDKTYVSEILACGEEIGRSSENRPIYVFTIGSGEKKVLFIGGLHTGTEKNTYQLATKVLQHFYGKPARVPNGMSLYIIPKVNPDGIAHGSHNNARGVDLNRNWPTQDWRSDPYHPTYGDRQGAGGKEPLSEPETKAIYNFVVREKPDLIVSWHSQAGTVEGNDIGIAQELARVYAKAASYTNIKEWPYYDVTGTFLEAMREAGIAAVDVELASRKAEFKRNIKGVQAILEYLK